MALVASICRNRDALKEKERTRLIQISENRYFIDPNCSKSLSIWRSWRQSSGIGTHWMSRIVTIATFLLRNIHLQAFATAIETEKDCLAPVRQLNTNANLED